MKRDILSILGAFICSRIIGSLFVYLGHSQRPYLAEVPGGWRGVDHWWLNPWTTYDSQWYLEIAAHGYQQHTTAFFPLYPYLIKIFGPDMVHMTLAGVIISHIALLAGLAMVFYLTKEEFDRQTADKTIWLMAFWPTAIYYGAVYTESLFILLLAGTFWAVRHSRWSMAALSGGLVAASRNPGLLIGFSVALYPAMASPEKKTDLLGKWVVTITPIFTFLIIQMWFWWTFQDPLSGINSQSFYYRSWQWPWLPIINDLNVLCSFASGHGFVYYIVTSISLVVTCGVVGIVIFGRRRFRPGYLLLIGGITLMNLSYARTIGPHTISEVRYMGSLFPFIQILAVTVLQDTANKWIKVIFIGMVFYLFILFSYLFGLKVFLG